MNKILYGLSIVATAFLMACGNGGEKVEQHETAGNEHEQHEETNDGLTLNNGAKWVANPETTTGIGDMQAAISGYLQTDNPVSCEQLAGTLSGSFDGIIRECTMTGEAHEQLHHYILPLKHEIDALAGTAGTACNEQVAKLEAYLATYADYFE